MTQQAPANWYPDPSDSSLQRYWDGARWTEHTAPYQSEQVQPQAAQTPGPGWSGPQPRDNRLVVAGWIAGGLALLVSLGGGPIGFLIALLAAVFGVRLLRQGEGRRQGFAILALAVVAVILSIVSG